MVPAASVSARAPGLRLRFAGARRILRPPDFPRPAARWHLSIRLEIQPAVVRRPAHARTRAPLQIIHGLTGSTLSNPAMTTCVYQRNRKAVRSSKCGKLPTTNSSLRNSQLRSQLRIRRNLCSLCNLCTLGTLCSLCSRSRGLPVPCLEASPCSPCRRHRTSRG